jgi:pimeloyl-ACP methyl ester carboxylesterase
MATKVLFLIHGFNNHGEDGETKLLRWAKSLNLDEGWHIVAVLWPGDAKFIGFACYSFQDPDADDAGELLADRIEDIFGANRSVRICIATHSLGARVALQAVAKLHQRGWSKIDNLCVLAAAVDGTCLGSDAQYRQAVRQQVLDVGVLYSHWDPVLLGAFPLGELLQNFIFFWRGESLSVLALGYWGPQEFTSLNIKTPANVTHPTNASDLPGNYHYGHGDYIGYDSNGFINGKHRANVEKWLKDRLGAI